MTPNAARPRFDFRDSRVLVTGHTGFKGAWLSEWLLQMGARVAGLALPPDSPDSLFSRLRLDERMAHHVCDVRNGAAVGEVLRSVEPEVVIHMAAQALVRRGYREPVLTFETNVAGTLNVLEAARSLKERVVVIAVTTDKVYKNREWEFAYRETDELGGHDPYSASKAACELAVAAWRASFADSGVRVATARAGNVIGAGDSSEDRIVPDCFRAWSRAEAVVVRNPNSTRPWQHVLEPLSGYLALAAYLREGRGTIDACNFGPGDSGERAVETLVRALVALEPSRRWVVAPASGVHEARSLALAIDRARLRLGWAPRLGFEEAVEWTHSGYVATEAVFAKIVARQIAAFETR